MAELVKFQIEGMRCGHCVARIKSLLETRPGVKMADVSLERKEAQVIH